jgi:hypothetical protein
MRIKTMVKNSQMKMCQTGTKIKKQTERMHDG